jgi:hypothetical protein
LAVITARENGTQRKLDHSWRSTEKGVLLVDTRRVHVLYLTRCQRNSEETSTDQMNRTMQLVAESASTIQADGRGKNHVLVVAHDGGGSRRKATTTTAVTATAISALAADKRTIT